LLLQTRQQKYIYHEYLPYPIKTLIYLDASLIAAFSLNVSWCIFFYLIKYLRNKVQLRSKSISQASGKPKITEIKEQKAISKGRSKRLTGAWGRDHSIPAAAAVCDPVAIPL
jgi:hypothetical protein